MNRRFNTSPWGKVGLAAIVFIPAFAVAAEAVDHLNVQEPTRPSYLDRAPSGAFQLPPVAPLPTPPERDSGETVRVNRIVFQGNTVISTDELNDLVASYRGQLLSEADFEELRLKITRHYIERGYVNSGALFGDSPLVGDELTIRLVEGRLKSISLHGMGRLDEDYLTKRLWRNPEAVFNINQLRERYQSTLDDPLFKRMNARLLPADRLGEAWLDVDVERALPYQLSVFANNYRPPSIGANAIGLSGWLRNLTGYGDYLEVNVQGSSQTEDGRRSSLGWRMPLNTLGTQLSLQFEHGRSAVVEEPMRILDIKSTLDSRDLGLSQTIVETLSHKLSLGLNRVERENRTTVADEPFSFVQGEQNGHIKVSAWRFWQEYSYRSERQVLALRSTLTAARNNLQEINGLPPGATLPAQQRYQIWLGQAQYAHRVLENGAQLIGRATLQQTSDRLLSLDRMSIGGIYTVRGYRENEMLRDKGRIFNFEFDYPVIRQSENGFNLALIPFYDIGRAQNQDESAKTISSVGLASRLRWQGLRLDFAFAKRLLHPNEITSNGGTLQDKGMHLQLAFDFF